jgi:hypothetical protein
MALAPEDWITHIDREANVALENRWSRFSVGWGKWSAAMNRHIRDRIAANDKQAFKYKVVFVYWILMSQAIEFAHKKSKGKKVDDTRFTEVVRQLEEVREDVKHNIWKDHTVDQIKSIVIGVK